MYYVYFNEKYFNSACLIILRKEKFYYSIKYVAGNVRETINAPWKKEDNGFESAIRALKDNRFKEILRLDREPTLEDLEEFTI